MRDYIVTVDRTVREKYRVKARSLVHACEAWEEVEPFSSDERDCEIEDIELDE